MESSSLLETIGSPDDLKKLNSSQLYQLCCELREKLINTVSLNGGHLASNLGVVELTVALHSVFESPKDEIVWDVGHQAYTHKLLTGRQKKFSTLRQCGGMSGFTKPCESSHDPYGAGHSSTSISAACGLARAKTLLHEDGYVIAVIGDGALTGGLAYEGMNNAGRCGDRLIVILNDNKMSISKNVGAMARHLSIIRAKPLYFKMKDSLEDVLSHMPHIGPKLRRVLVASKSAVKNILYHSNIFEEMGFAYLGPVDGHNIEDMRRLFIRAKHAKCPTLIHVMTIKGKGYQFAENNPRRYHGVSCFDVETGEPVSVTEGKTYSGVFGSTLCALADDDERICAITAAMAAGTGLSGFAEKYKNRFFDVGIAEEHAVVFGAGLASGGLLPVFAVYSTFLQRAYDQILHDAALQKLNVVFAIDRAGFIGQDGETHQGIYDAAYLNTIPGITVYSPSTFDELTEDLKTAVYDTDGPVAVRYPRGQQDSIPEGFHPSCGSFDLYMPDTSKADVLLVTYGRLFSKAAAALEKLLKNGVHAYILKLNRIKPIDPDCIDTAMEFSKVLFFEEGIKAGGIGEHFGIRLIESGFSGSYRVYAVDDAFVKQGTVTEQLSAFGLDAAGMAETVLRECVHIGPKTED